MFCASCGGYMDSDAKFCSKCGAPRRQNLRMVSMTCPNCKAQLEMAEDHLMACCPYCEQKLIFDFQGVDKVLVEKERTRRHKVKREYDIREKELDFEQKQKKEKKEGVSIFFSFIGVVVMLGILWGVVFVTNDFRDKKHESKLAVLQDIVEQIDDAILQEDYDKALLLTARLYLDDGYSEEEAAAWDAKRESYVLIINELRR